MNLSLKLEGEFKFLLIKIINLTLTQQEHLQTFYPKEEKLGHHPQLTHSSYKHYIIHNESHTQNLIVKYSRYVTNFQNNPFKREVYNRVLAIKEGSVELLNELSC